MKNLVVAFDFDYTSRNAAKYAAEITKHSKMQLTLYHSFETVYPPADLPYINDYISEFQQDYSGKMENYVEKLRNRYDLPSIRWMVRPGTLTDNLEDYTREEKTALIVAGVNKKSLLDEAIQGSTSFKLFKNTSIPVLAVPIKAKFTGIHKVLVPFNFSAPEKKDFSAILELQRSFGFEVIVLGMTRDRFKDQEVSDGKAFLERTFAGTPYRLLMKAGQDLPDLIERTVRTELADVLVVSPDDESILDAMGRKAQSRNLMNSLSRTTMLFLPARPENGDIQLTQSNTFLRRVS